MMPKEITLVLLERDFVLNERGRVTNYTNCQDCPIARAFKRQFPEVEFSVNGLRIRIMESYFPYKKYHPEKSIGGGALRQYAEKLQTQSKVLLKFTLKD